MSEQSNIKVDQCTVLFMLSKQNGNRTESNLKSTSFIFNQSKCHLEIICAWGQKMMAYIKSDPFLSQPFFVTVIVVKGNNVKSYNEFKVVDSKKNFWSNSLMEISEQVPGIEKWNFILKFEFRTEESPKIFENKIVATSPCLSENHSLLQLSRDFGELLKDESTKDVELLVANGNRISGHKDVFRARSPFLKSKLDSSRVIDMSNVSGAAAQAIVYYIYTAKIDLNFELAKQIYKARNICDVGNLKELSVKFLIENLREDNACQCLALTDDDDDDDFKEKVIEFIKDKEIMFNDQYWIPFCKDYSKLANDVLNKLLRKFHTRNA